MNYSTNAFLARVYNAALAEASHSRAALRAALGLDNFERWFPGFEPVVTGGGGEYTLEALPGLISPLFALPAAPGARVAVVYCHGHGGGARDAIEKDTYAHALPKRLAAEGYAVFVPELMGFGECIYEGYNEPAMQGCYANNVNLLMAGATAAGARVKQIAAAVALARRSCGIVALYGISGGAMAAGYAQASGEAGADALCAASYPGMFKDSVLPRRHCIDNYIPGVLGCGEYADILKLAADKPVLIMSGLKDPSFPAASAKAVYEQVGGMAQLSLFDGGHEACAEPFVEWLGKL